MNMFALARSVARKDSNWNSTFTQADFVVISFGVAWNSLEQ